MMHDWTLIKILINWLLGTVEITFKNDQSKVVQLVAAGLVNLRVPKREEWGPSISVNEVEGPCFLENGNCYLCLEIQSGDRIEVEAKSISLPEN